MGTMAPLRPGWMTKMLGQRAKGSIAGVERLRRPHSDVRATAQHGIEAYCPPPPAPRSQGSHPSAALNSQAWMSPKPQLARARPAPACGARTQNPKPWMSPEPQLARARPAPACCARTQNPKPWMIPEPQLARPTPACCARTQNPEPWMSPKPQLARAPPAPACCARTRWPPPPAPRSAAHAPRPSFAAPWPGG
jgi:hypothetical protein